MANVLMQQGKVQEALALYEEALRTKQGLGDVRGVAVTRANVSQLLLQQGEHGRALHLAWQAYSSLEQQGYTSDAQVMRQLLTSIKGEVLGPGPFDARWAEVIAEPQPGWLRAVQES